MRTVYKNWNFNYWVRAFKIHKKQLTESDKTIAGFNIGVNSGKVSGQTVEHCHIHLIPRRSGDTEDPFGGGKGSNSGKTKVFLRCDFKPGRLLRWNHLYDNSIEVLACYFDSGLILFYITIVYLSRLKNTLINKNGQAL